MKVRHILFILSIFVLGGVFTGTAGEGVGSWKVYSSFNGVQHLTVTRDKVFYISAGQLYSYDKDNDETYNYSTGGKLSDTNVSKIYYNYEKDYLLVIYKNSNIDIIEKDDRVYNMPDIKDAELSVVPSINDVAFTEDRAYMATNFGCVVFDTKKREVISAGDYGREMTACTLLNGKLFLGCNIGKTYYIGKDENVASLARFKEGFDFVAGQFKLISEEVLVIKSLDEKSLHVFSIPKGKDPDGDNIIFKGLKYTDTKFAPLQITESGRVFTHTDNKLYYIDAECNIEEITLTGTPLQSLRFSTGFEEKKLYPYGDNSEIWMGNSEGIGCYSIEEGGKVTVHSAQGRPYGLTLSKIGRLSTSPSGKIYVSSYGWGMVKGIFKSDENALFHINVITDGEIKDITPVEYTIKNKNNPCKRLTPYGFKSGAHVMEDPSDPDAYYVGSGWDGLYRFKDGKETHHYCEDNSSMRSVLNGYTLRVYGFDIDKNDNLWAASYVLEGEPYIHMLTKENRIKENVTPADWEEPFYISDPSGYETQVIACRHSDAVIVKESYYQGFLMIIKTKGTTSVADDEVCHVTDFIDQDGRQLAFNYFMYLIEDKNGKVWVGTDNGIFEIGDPTTANGNTIRVNHLKVPRKDGTNFADYLLDGEIIYWMDVDPANRKWIATQNSGLYLVNADGSEILEHFDKTNSPLGSNLVTAVTCGTDNTVYIGTENGLLSYKSDASPAKEDFSEVYAYPNPVRPDYTGWITVTGLMENSLVKIADSAGNVFYQTTSEGGMITWDGCDRSGNRVKTGVYYVFASSGGASGESSRGAVTKILVVN